MLTRAGWTVVAGTAATLVAGRLLGVTEAYVVVAAGVVAVLGALLWVRVRPLGLTVDRTIRPHRVHVGRATRVELAVRATGRAATPVVTFVDSIDGRAGARLRVAPVGPGATARAAYRLPTRARGEIGIGPLTVEVADPLGLAVRRREAAGHVRLVVLPHVDPIAPLPSPAGTEPLSGREGRAAFGAVGDEPHTLRPYVIGDDIRRIHWPMSARTDDLIVRQDEEPRQGRMTIALDVAPAVGAVTFEAMVSAAASLAVAHRAGGDHVRLVTTAGHDTGWVTGRAALDHLLDDLAVVTTSERADLGRVLTQAERAPHSLVLVTASRSDDELARVAALRERRVGRRTLIVVRFPGPSDGERSSAAGVRLVEVGDGPFTRAWEAALVRAGRRPVGAS